MADKRKDQNEPEEYRKVHAEIVGQEQVDLYYDSKEEESPYRQPSMRYYRYEMRSQGCGCPGCVGCVGCFGLIILVLLILKIFV